MASPERPTVDHYFMDMTHLVKARGTCPRRQVGAVIVKDKRVLTTGYNGAPRNFPHPIDVGCLRDELQIPRGMVADICPCLHAEQNAIIQAATTGVSIEGADIYCTTQPCTQCSRMLANCGVKRVIFEEAYPDPLAVGILTTSGVELWQWDASAMEAKRLLRTNTFEQAQDELRRKWAAGELHVQPKPGQIPMATAGVPRAAPPAKGATALPPRAKAAQPPATAPRARAEGAARAAPTTPPEALAGDAAAPDDGLAEHDPKAVGVRDLRDDPHREELIRKMAREKALQRKKAQADLGGPANP